jgi:hypothetical protein
MGGLHCTVRSFDCLNREEEIRVSKLSRLGEAESCGMNCSGEV